MAVTDLHLLRKCCRPRECCRIASPASGRPQRRQDVAVEVGKTMLILTFIAAGIVALRYALVAAYGLLH